MSQLGYRPYRLINPMNPVADASVLIEATQQIAGGQPITVLAETTDACEHLAIVPVFTVAGGYSGGFTALHIPTGLTLPAWPGERFTPDEIRDGIARVSGPPLDWSSPCPEFYRASEARHRDVWISVIRHMVETGSAGSIADDEDEDKETPGGCVLA